VYKIAIIISTIPSFNVYRNTLEKAFNSGNYNHFLIGSGFFHHRNNSKGPFYASDAFSGATFPSSGSVTVVGAYNPGSQEFDMFVANLKTGLNVAGKPTVAVTQRRSQRKYANHWHAKIFIAREDQTHRLAVVGSSNLTRSAFDSAASNNEADVLIWDDSHLPTRQIVNTALARPEDVQGENLSNPAVVVSDYVPDDPRNSSQGSLNDRLGMLWEDVLAATVLSA
jgi:hypothetical protein